MLRGLCNTCARDGQPPQSAVQVPASGICRGRELCTPGLTRVVTDVAIAAMHKVLSLLFAAVLAGCASNAERIDRLTRDAHLQRVEMTGAGYRHVVYMNRAAQEGHAGDQLFVFLEGDGIPAVDGGYAPAADPTTRHPIALQLLTLTDAPGIYVSRPCYQQLVDTQCTSDAWTGGRYSAAVVASIAAVIRDISQQAHAREVVLVGHSGGGVLAVLAAERLDNVAEVLTLGANLDVAAWARHHGYTPLATSLDPAASTAPHPWREIHFSGTKDTVVPAATRAAYFTRYPAARQVMLLDYDHTCCWVKDWASLLAR